MSNVVLVGCLLALTGCGYNLTLMASDGAMGTGRATGMGTGTLEVQLNGKLYRGTWVTAEGGSMGFGTVGTTSFSVMSADSGTTGNAMLSAGDGSTLQCRFVYGGMSAAGYGQCQDNTGKRYELQIS